MWTAARALSLVISLLLVGGCSSSTPDAQPKGSKDEHTLLGWHRVAPTQVPLPGKGLTSLGSTGPRAGGAAQRPVVINFWASTCAPCVKELPLLQRLSRSGQVTVLGVSRDYQKQSALRMLTSRGVTYPNWMDPDGNYMRTFRRMIPVNEIPSSVLVEGGRVTYAHIGPFTSEADLRRHLSGSAESRASAGGGPQDHAPRRVGARRWVT